MTFTVSTKYGDYKARLCVHNPLNRVEICIIDLDAGVDSWYCVEREEITIKGEDHDES